MAAPNTTQDVAGPRSGNALTIGLIALSVVMTFAAVTFYMGRSAEHTKRVWAESQLEELLRVKSALERERDELQTAKTELEAKIQELDGQVTSLTDQAEQLSSELATEKRAADTARRQAGEAATRVETERREKLAMADELAKAKQDTKRLQDELTQLRQAKEALERRVKGMMTGTASTPAPDTIVVTPQPPQPPPAGGPRAVAGPLAAATPGAGSVLVVNREFNFIVVNLGERDGLKAGQALEVVRVSRVIAKVQVERVYDNMAAANILQETTKGDVVREGDSVRRD